MIPGCTIQLAFFCGLSALFQHVDLVTTLLRQFETICWELNRISGFFAFLSLSVWTDESINVPYVFQEARDADSRAHTRSQV